MIALDTSVAIPLVIGTHSAHQRIAAWRAGREVRLAGHALAETYSVLTRLPGDLRLTPADAVRLIESRFAASIGLSARTAKRVPRILAAKGIAGGAVYDALVGLAAKEHRCTLATRDARALATYQTLGVDVEPVG